LIFKFSQIILNFVRWQKTALLVFLDLAFMSAKTKCAVCAAGFSACSQRLVYEK
jgi:hypothetical protein